MVGSSLWLGGVLLEETTDSPPVGNRVAPKRSVVSALRHNPKPSGVAEPPPDATGQLHRDGAVALPVDHQQGLPEGDHVVDQVDARVLDLARDKVVNDRPVEGVKEPGEQQERQDRHANSTEHLQT